MIKKFSAKMEEEVPGADASADAPAEVVPEDVVAETTDAVEDIVAAEPVEPEPIAEVKPSIAQEAGQVDSGTDSNCA